MNAFRFRLQQLLNFRASKEERAQREFSRGLALLLRQETLRDEMYRNLSAQYGEWNRGRMTFTDIADFRMYNHYLGRLENEIKAQLARIRQQTVVTEELRQLLLAASRDKKVMERLKERTYQEFTENVNRMEQRFLDELAGRAAATAQAAGMVMAHEG
jgi:flagellar FliJ protein